MYLMNAREIALIIKTFINKELDRNVAQVPVSTT